MSRDHDEITHRPERVIMVDVDDPLTEVHGEFVWREDHDRAIAVACQQGYSEGYAAGAADSADTSVHFHVRRRRGPLGYLSLIVLVLLALFVLLMLLVVLT